MRNLEFNIGQFPQGRGLGGAINDAQLAAALQVSGELQRSRLVEAFADGGHQKRGGTKWAPLAASTRRRKQRRGKTKILVNTGRLRNSLRVRVRRNGSGVVLVFSADAPYAGFHQFGTSRMPARPVVEITASDEDRIVRDVRRAVERMVNGRARG